MRENKKMKFKTGNEALEYLAQKSRILEKDYWSKVLDIIRKFECIFIKWAQNVNNFIKD